MIWIQVRYGCLLWATVNYYWGSVKAILRSPKKFKKSVGNWIARDLSGTESKDLYSTQSPGNCSTRAHG